MEYVKEYNKEAGYDYIFNGANVLIGDEAHNITAHVLKVLNERYTASNPERFI